ncbi:MAG: TIR domain-containing protein [Pyrinomonadaceae bacterium]
MPAEIKLKIITMGGEEMEITTPDDITVGDFIRELRLAINLPFIDTDGRPITWQLDNKDTGQTLDSRKIFVAQGVVEGHHLSFIRTTATGCFPESAKLLLPSGAYVPIGSIKPHDSILTFDPSTASYSAGQVKGVYLETYARQVVINKRLVTTPDQHFLLANRTWTIAERLTEGDILLEFPFKHTVIEAIAREEILQPMRSLTLKSPLCFIMEGWVVRDLLGKQAKLPKAVDVFLSYATADKDEARIIFELLEREKITVFLAERSIEAGQVWEGAIKEALKSCHHFWLLVTPESLRSEWVITEWASAWALDKTIVPILFRCQPKDLPARLRAYQCIDFHQVEQAIETLKL